MSDARINALVKFRDGLRQAVDAIEEYLETMAPPGAQGGARGPAAGSAATWDPQKIRWEEATGTNGPYQRSQDTSSPDFQALVADLSVHKDKLMRGGFFYWKFQDGASVGRKLKGKASS